MKEERSVLKSIDFPTKCLNSPGQLGGSCDFRETATIALEYERRGSSNYLYIGEILCKSYCLSWQSKSREDFGKTRK